MRKSRRNTVRATKDKEADADHESKEKGKKDKHVGARKRKKRSKTPTLDDPKDVGMKKTTRKKKEKRPKTPTPEDRKDVDTKKKKRKKGEKEEKSKTPTPADPKQKVGEKAKKRHKDTKTGKGDTKDTKTGNGDTKTGKGKTQTGKKDTKDTKDAKARQPKAKEPSDDKSDINAASSAAWSGNDVSDVDDSSEAAGDSSEVEKDTPTGATEKGEDAKEEVEQKSAALSVSSEKVNEDLNKAIETFQLKVKEMALTKPDLSVLKGHFSGPQMSALWMRLQGVRCKQDMSVTKAWSMICGLKTGASLAKREVLWEFLTAPPRSWINRLLSVTETLSKSESDTNRCIPMTRGEIERLHGESEAADLIERGWFDTQEQNGVTLYIKKQRITDETTARKRQTSMTKTYLGNKPSQQKRATRHNCQKTNTTTHVLTNIKDKLLNILLKQ